MNMTGSWYTIDECDGRLWGLLGGLGKDNYRIMSY